MRFATTESVVKGFPPVHRAEAEAHDWETEFIDKWWAGLETVTGPNRTAKAEAKTADALAAIWLLS